MSNLLLDENPLIILPKLAVKIGLNESIVLQQIHYWLEINKKAGKNLRDGFYWTYNSYKEWQEQLPFFSLKTIQRTIERLEKLNLLVVSNYNKLKIDRTKWYRIEYNVLQSLENQPFSQNDLTSWSKCPDQLDKMTSPLPETISETKNKNYQKELNHIDIFSKNVCVNENINGKFYANEKEMTSDFNKYINNYNLTTAGKVFIFKLVEKFYIQLLCIKNIKHGVISEEIIKKCIGVIIDNYSAYDLIDNYSLYIEEYFKSNRKYYSFQDFCNADTLRILAERSRFI